MKKKLKLIKGDKAKLNRSKAEAAKEMGTCDYITRGFGLLADHWLLWTTGMVCVLATTIAGLLMPNYQVFGIRIFFLIITPPAIFYINPSTNPGFPNSPHFFNPG